ncbi:polyprenol phosphomannose-dependent alpha 1,6 mannosyltransferase MptB [Streptomyces sp. NPDC091292]|uniref:polyprenol phosphomannose-dependent alpha 1,6 mannosyltransferase MptB n=1 Tax=Streptomyces sp. NPDC091292 TaxID=3365991 RepID=UPI0037F432E2
MLALAFTGSPGSSAPSVDVRRCQLLGLIGSTVLSAGGATAGALPLRDTFDPASGHASLGLVCAYFGLVLLITAWWRMGRAVRGPQPPSQRSLLLTLAIWASPLLIAPPLFSRDVYSYLAQGAMADAHMDVYTYGPAQLGGPFASEVAPLWQHTPAPYGPVAVGLAAAIAKVSSSQLSAGLFGMRLVALLGVALMVAALPALARRCGTDPRAAVWLGALNPLLLLHLVAGAHNDAVMLGLLGVGLVAVMGGRPLPGAVLVTLAALVKAPAALGLVAVAVLWAGHLTGRYRWWRAGAATLAVGLATTAAATAVTGTGYGWLTALGTPASPDNWSLTSVLGRLAGSLLEGAGSELAPLALPAFRLLGLCATGVAVLLIWLRRPRTVPVHALGLSLLAVAFLGPATRPWYLLWGLFLVAAATPDSPVRRVVAGGCAVLALMVLPSGFAPDQAQLVLAVTGGVLAALALLQARLTPSFPSSASTLHPAGTLSAWLR